MLNPEQVVLELRDEVARLTAERDEARAALEKAVGIATTLAGDSTALKMERDALRDEVRIADGFAAIHSKAVDQLYARCAQLTEALREIAAAQSNARTDFRGERKGETWDAFAGRLMSMADAALAASDSGARLAERDARTREAALLGWASRLRRFAEAVMLHYDEETTGSAALDNLLNAAMDPDFDAPEPPLAKPEPATAPPSQMVGGFRQLGETLRPLILEPDQSEIIRLKIALSDLIDDVEENCGRDCEGSAKVLQAARVALRR